MPGMGNAMSEAKNEFHHARMRGSLAAVSARLNGKSIALLSFDDVANKLKITGQATRGIETIPLEAIVGSVGRYNDFTRTFLPRLKSDADRWASVRLAGSVTSLPPIDVYKVGDAYFVLDGNHRVSIAMQRNLAFIDAYVVEVRTKVPLAPDDDLDDLIIKAEYVGFLERTRLDQLRPGADLLVSAPGQYETLENLIEVHRFFIEMEQLIELTDAEAVARWYDEAYLPMVTAVREQGILRYFPGRTETDFYVWLAKHQAHLRNELGLELEPDVVVKLATQFKPRPNRRKKRSPRRILKVLTSGISKRSEPEPRWSQEKMLDRYSHALFVDILMPLLATAVSGHGWAPAINLASREQARVLGLVVGPESAAADQPANLLQQACQAAGVALQQARENGAVVETICRRAALADLVVLDATFDRSQVLEIAQRSPRPIMVLNNTETEINRVLLAYDGSPKAHEALFVAAYLAEQWPGELVVATAQESRRQRDVADFARRYLEMHEVNALFVQAPGKAAPLIMETAVNQHCDLVLLGGSGSGAKGRSRLGATVAQLVDWGERPLLICP